MIVHVCGERRNDTRLPFRLTRAILPPRAVRRAGSVCAHDGAQAERLAPTQSLLDSFLQARKSRGKARAVGAIRV